MGEVRAMTQSAIHVTTLGEFKAAGYRLFANCETPWCAKGAALDIDQLIERYGADYVVTNDTRIAAAVRCSFCGRRGGKLTVQPR